INPMGCRPCSGFFPEPAVGSMSLLPPTFTSTSISSATTSSTLNPSSSLSSSPQNSQTEGSTGSSLNSSSSSNSTSSTPLIAGIASGVVVCIAVIAGIVFFAVCRRDRKSRLTKMDFAGNGSTSAKETYTNDTGGDASGNNNTVDVRVERATHEPEVDFFAVATTAREVPEIPPPSYVHVAAIAQRTAGAEFEGGSVGMSSIMGKEVKSGYAGNVEKPGSSALFDGVSSVDEKERFRREGLLWSENPREYNV
ncbi:hypothetical protein HDU76_006504, partial [Blyttiomyces sp. JEL0837]